MKDDNIESRVEFFKALGEPARLKIVMHLLKEKSCTCICHIATLIGRDQSVAFRHIGILKDAGIVETKKDGNFLMCSLKEPKRIGRIMEE